MTTWMESAACADLGRDPEDWFPHESGHLLTEANQKAKAICTFCPVRAKCLQFAVEHNIAYGIYGGLTAPERKRAGKREAKKESKCTARRALRDAMSASAHALHRNDSAPDLASAAK